MLFIFRFPSHYDQIHFVSKIILLIAFEFSVGMVAITRYWFCNICNVILQILNFIVLMKEQPFFNYFVQNVNNLI